MLYPHPLSRTRDGHAQLHAHASSSSSLSSAASSDLLPAAPPSNSSQSDIATDYSPPSSYPSKPTPLSSSLPNKGKAHRFFHPRTNRSTSANSMGQVLAPASTPPPRPTSPSNAAGGNAAGGRFKRAWAARRKKSEDVSAVYAGPPPNGKERESNDAPPGAYASTSDLSHTLSHTPSHLTPERPAKLLAPLQIASTKLNVFSTKRTMGGSEPKAPGFSGSPPPPPPKEPIALVSSPPQLATPQRSLRVPMPNDREPSPAPIPRQKDTLPSIPPSSPSMSPSPSPATAIDKLKEDWRKSDSTMTSHTTIRPGSLGGSRSPRPVSLAESSHSGNTIVPQQAKRLSALLTDAEFMMVEEGPGDGIEDEGEGEESGAGVRETLLRVVSREDGLLRAVSRERERSSHSPVGSLKARNRRSLSLSVGPGHPFRSSIVEQLPTRPPSSTGYHVPHSPGHGSPLATSTSRDTPTLTRTAASGFIAPLNPVGAHHTTGSHIKSKLAAWTSVSAGSTPIQMHPDRPLPAAPSQQRGWRRQQPSPIVTPHVSQTPPPSFRQTAVSMTGSLAPAAGFAVGLGKRAMEKMTGRAWGSGVSNSSHTSVNTPSVSSASSVASSDHGHGYALGRTVSKDSNSVLSQSTGGGSGGMGITKKARRRKFGGHAPSLADSVASSAASDADVFMTNGPGLGRRVRGPRRTPSGASIIGGLVFKRDLKTCVKDTAIDGVLQQEEQEHKGMKPLEERRVPALVVRCAQHLLRWGVQEEGLFRVSGRSSHVARLRSEFDAGSDWDMAASGPGELDPHAVASIFKTYLRELPESILTANLIPYFESALSTEDQASRASIDSSANSSVKSSAPSHHRSGSSLGLHKAPSLSTLAIPSFAGQRSVSESLLNALTWLISRLPAENRDLLYTVVQLIKATAAHSKVTKMTLGNLLLVFCPSLNMNPGLLRVLCEHDSIWEGVPQAAPTVDAEQEDEDSEEEEEDIRATFVTARETRFSVYASDMLSQNTSTASTDDRPTDDEDTDLITPEDSAIAVVDTAGVKAGNRSAKIVPMELPDDPDTLVPSLHTKADNRSAQITPEMLVLPPISPVSPVSLRDDCASFVSALEPPSTGPTRSPSPAGGSGSDGYSPQTMPPLSSSAESLSSPSEMSEEPISPRTGRPSTDTDTDAEEEARRDRGASRVNTKPLPPLNPSASQDSLAIPVPMSEARERSLPPATSRRPMIDTSVSVPSESTVAPAPAVSVPFPSTGGSTPNTPTRRKSSFALLSFPSLRSDPGPGPSAVMKASPAVSSTPGSLTSSPAVAPPSSWHRPNRPSLHLLLQKLSGGGSRPPTPSVSNPSPAMASVPALAVYASESKGAASSSLPMLAPSPMERSEGIVPSACPKLDTAISSSPINMGFHDENDERHQAHIEQQVEKNNVTVIPDVRLQREAEDDSPASSRSGSGSRSSSGSDREPSPYSAGHTRSRTESYAPSLYMTPMWTTPQTPIADLYQNSPQARSKSALSFFNTDQLEVPGLGVGAGRSQSVGVSDAERGREREWEKSRLNIMARSRSEASQVSVTPSIELPVESQEDWAESVLMAAQSTRADEEESDILVAISS